MFVPTKSGHGGPPTMAQPAPVPGAAVRMGTAEGDDLSGS